MESNFVTVVRKFQLAILPFLFFGMVCKPSLLENANDIYSDEFTETQILLCLLQVGFCSPNIPIQPLVQFDFTNGSIVNSGSLVLTLISPEWAPATTVGKDGDSNGAYLNTTNNQYFTTITNGDSGLPMGANPRTMCAWIYPTLFPAINDHHIVVRYGNSTTANGSALAISNLSGNKISFFGSGYDAHADYTIVINTWSHLCATFQGGTTITFYVNGNLIANQVLAGTGPLNTTSSSFSIGTFGGSGYPNYWRGAFDDVRIYDKALNATQIRQIYTTGYAY